MMQRKSPHYRCLVEASKRKIERCQRSAKREESSTHEEHEEMISGNVGCRFGDQLLLKFVTRYQMRINVSVFTSVDRLQINK